MNHENYSILEVRDLVVDLKNISIFLSSGAWQVGSSQDESALLDIIFSTVKNKIAIIDSSLSNFPYEEESK